MIVTRDLHPWNILCSRQNDMKPQRLKKKDTIGIVSPARWLNEDALGKAVELFEKEGYRVKLGPASFLKDHQYAGTTEQRARELQEMFADETVNAIICARGGYGAIRVTDSLNYDIIRNNPKIFVGYSDITALHTSLLRMTSLVTFHGPMLKSFSEERDQFSWHYLLEVLSGGGPVDVQFPEDLMPVTLRKGVAEGELFGGNLTLLINMIGTPWDFDPSGKILFVEDIDEKLYRIDRLLLHLKRSGKLDGISGLVVGEMKDIYDEEIPFGKTVEEIVMDVCKGTDFPIVANFPCGHGTHQMTMPISIKARLDCTTRTPSFTLLEPAVL